MIEKTVTEVATFSKTSIKYNFLSFFFKYACEFAMSTIPLLPPINYCSLKEEFMKVF